MIGGQLRNPCGNPDSNPLLSCFFQTRWNKHWIQSGKSNKNSSMQYTIWLKSENSFAKHAKNSTWKKFKRGEIVKHAFKTKAKLRFANTTENKTKSSSIKIKMKSRNMPRISKIRLRLGFKPTTYCDLEIINLTLTTDALFMTNGSPK